jgi:hypothetical protein
MERFLLPRFAYAVDGMMVRFDCAPRDFPANIDLQDFNCRKNFYALNCQVVCNDEFLICDLDCDWPGRTHDARVWAWSDVRTFLESVPGAYYIAGDSAYPISPVLMKPYSNREAQADPLSRLFNARLSALRTVMSENVFARLVKIVGSDMSSLPFPKNYTSKKYKIYYSFNLLNFPFLHLLPLFKLFNFIFLL